MKILWLVPSYLAVSFVLSAFLVRIAPQLGTSRLLLRNLALFVLLPLLLAIDLCLAVCDALGGAGRLFARLFEALAGRSLKRRATMYSHSSYGRPKRRSSVRSQRRRNEGPARRSRQRA